MPLLKGNIFEGLANKVWNGKYAEDVGIALIHLGAAGWVLSALAQILMLARNKDIDKKEKRFLIPQEIADGVVNVGLYYSICQVIKNIGDHMSENIQYMTKQSNDFLKIMKPDSHSNLEFIKGFAETFRNYGITKVKKQIFRHCGTLFYRTFYSTQWQFCSLGYIIIHYKNKKNHKYIFLLLT